MVTVQQIMTVDPVTVGPELTLRDALETMTAEHVGGLPVVSGERVMGVISASDLLDFQGDTEVGPPARSGAVTEEGVLEGRPGEVDATVSGPQEDDPAAAYFAELWGQTDAAATSWLDEPRVPSRELLEEHTVAEIMTRSVLSVEAETPAREAARKMLEAGVHRLLVMEDEKLVGILTTTDFVKAVSQHDLGG